MKGNLHTPSHDYVHSKVMITFLQPSQASCLKSRQNWWWHMILVVMLVGVLKLADIKLNKKDNSCEESTSIRDVLSRTTTGHGCLWISCTGKIFSLVSIVNINMSHKDPSMTVHCSHVQPLSVKISFASSNCSSCVMQQQQPIYWNAAPDIPNLQTVSCIYNCFLFWQTVSCMYPVQNSVATCFIGL